jgi:ADP-heptose:LPS heptosyltransferase
MDGGTVTPSNAVKRVLIYRLGTLGDTVVALPALNVVARAFPAAERRLLTSFPPNAKASPSSAILENTGLVHGYFRYTLRTRNVRELISLWLQLLKWRPEVLIDLSPASGIADAKRNSFFFRLCGITRIVGAPITDDMQHPRPIVGAEKRFEYEASRLARNIASLGRANLDDPAYWDLKITRQEFDRAAEVLAPAGERPIIAVGFGTKNQSNDWGAERWHELLTRLARLYPQHSLAICGAAVETQQSDTVASGWRECSAAPVINLCGVLTPRESAAVFKRADIFLGHDSGPMHLASAVQTPCVVVFSARNPAGIWFPYGDRHQVLYHHVSCENCGLETCILEKKKCILSITVEEVLERISRILPPPDSGLVTSTRHSDFEDLLSHSS